MQSARSNLHGFPTFPRRVAKHSALEILAEFVTVSPFVRSERRVEYESKENVSKASDETTKERGITQIADKFVNKIYCGLKYTLFEFMIFIRKRN